VLLWPTFDPEHNATMQDTSGAWSTILAVGFYMVTGPALIIVNRTILKDVGFSYPILLSALGQGLSGLTSRVLIDVFGVVKMDVHTRELASDWKFVMTSFVPVGACQALALACGNAVYMYLHMGFIQMLKSFTPVIVMMTLHLSGVEKMSVQVAVSIGGIAIGTMISSSWEASANLIGLVLFVTSSLGESFRLVITQFVLQKKKLTVFASMYYLAPVSALWLLALSCYSEIWRLFSSGDLGLILENPGTFFATCILSIAINFAGFWVVKVSSSLLLKVLGTVRNAFLIVWGMMVYGEEVTMQSTVGYAITLLCFAMYTKAKMAKPAEANKHGYSQLPKEGKGAVSI
jgi:hypothetical protein